MKGSGAELGAQRSPAVDLEILASIEKGVVRDVAARAAGVRSAEFAAWIDADENLASRVRDAELEAVVSPHLTIFKAALTGASGATEWLTRHAPGLLHEVDAHRENSKPARELRALVRTWCRSNSQRSA